MGGNEEFQNRQALAEIRFNRQVNDAAGRVGHQTAQTGQLPNLLLIAARAGVRHHKNRIKGVKVIHQVFSHILGNLLPNPDYATITFIFGNQAHFKLLFNLQNHNLGVGHNLGLFRGD